MTMTMTNRFGEHIQTVILEKFNLPNKDKDKDIDKETSQELRMLSSVTINCQITKIVMNSGSQLSEL